MLLHFHVSARVCVLSVRFQSAIPSVKTEILSLFLSDANPPLHFAFLHSSPYSVAPSLNSLSYYTHARAHTHTHTRPHSHYQ